MYICSYASVYLQDNFTAFKYAVEQERSKIVKYFVEEIKVDTTLYDQVINVVATYDCSISLIM